MEDALGIRDPKMLSYPLMQTPLPIVALSLLYLLIVLYIGPSWMKNRKPYDLRTPMFIYNISLVIVLVWLLGNVFIHGWFKYNFRCEPIDFSDSEEARTMTNLCWMLFCTKLVEYCDTIFFVLRKKENQINFLHVFHHSTVPITSWFGMSYGPGGYNMMFPTVNSFVHIWMYLYYGLSALGPGIQKYLWWKKYLTKLQLFQFVFVTGYFCQLYLFPKENCEVSPFLLGISLGQAIIYFIFFMHYYFRLYGKMKQKSKRVIQDKNDCSVKQNGHSHAD